MQRGLNKSDQRADVEIAALSLQTQILKPQFTTNGYVYLPTGQDYTALEALVTNEETQETRTIRASLLTEEVAH